MALRFLTILLVASSLAGCGDSESTAAPAQTDQPVVRPASHMQMIAQLERIARRTPDEDRFLGDAELRSMEAQLADLGVTATDEERLLLIMGIGEHHLRLGHTDVAVERMAEARKLVDELDASARREIEPQLLFRSAMAWMRAGETANCVTHHGPDSCLLPIRGGGVHVEPEGSEKASEFLVRMLEHEGCTRDLTLIGRWLLNIASMTLGTYPDGVDERWRIPPGTWASTAEMARFENVAAQAGLDTFSLCGSVVIEDLDGDDDLDILASTWDRTQPIRLFRNEEGRFTDCSDEAGLDGLYGGLNLVHADYDNDGDADVLVLRGAWMGFLGRHPNSLLQNDGGGFFTDVTYDVGLADVSYPTQAAAFADFDGDGDLDLFVANEAGPRHDYPCQLFRNDDGRFIDVAKTMGVENRRYAKGAAWGDYDGDGDPDLYVSNLRGRNRLYRNDGERFVDVAPELGVTGPHKSFPCWFFDYDQDGALDLFVAGYDEDVAAIAASYIGLEHSAETARLFRGNGRGGFEDVTDGAGISRRVITTMGAGWGDLDNDGFPDVYLGTGFPAYEALLPNTMLLNRSDGGARRYADVTTVGGFGHLQKGHGVAFADIDDDGDQDVFEQMGGAYAGDGFHDALFRNPGTPNRHLHLTLEGRNANRSALGARVAVMVKTAAGRRTIHGLVGPRGSFGSAPLRLELGLGAATAIERVRVIWPGSGRVQDFADLAFDRAYRLVEGGGAALISNRRG